MKILSISNTEIWPWGENKGIPSKFASQKGFADRGHIVYFLCPAVDAGAPARSEYHGITICRFQLPFGLGDSRISMMNSVGILNRLKATAVFNLRWFFIQAYTFFWAFKTAAYFKPDLVYAHSLEPALCGWFISRFFRAKFVTRVYGVKDLYWRRKDLLYRLKEFRNYLAFKLPADYFIFTYDGTGGAELAMSMGIPEGKIRNWRNGVDLDRGPEIAGARESVRQQLKLSTSTKIILSTSRLISIYGVTHTLRVCNELFKKESDSVLVIAGDGPQLGEMERFAKENGISSRVIFLGIVDHQRISELLRAADIFILLAKYHNCTNSMWEAMASGVCIVTTETEMIKEVIEADRHAILMPHDRINSLSEVLLGLLRDDERRQQLGRNVRARAEEILQGWPDRIGMEIRLLEDLVGKNVR